MANGAAQPGGTVLEASKFARLAVDLLPHTAILGFDVERRCVLAAGPLLADADESGALVTTFRDDPDSGPFSSLLSEGLAGHDGDIEFTTGDGRTIRALFTVVRSSLGAVDGVLTVFHDVSVRAAAQAALAMAEQERLRERAAAQLRFEQAFGHAPTGIVLTPLGEGGGGTTVNQRFCDMLGYTAEELDRIRPFDLIHADDREQARDLFDQLDRGELSVLETEHRLIRKDGGAIWVQVFSSSTRDAGGRIVGRATHVQDITERREAAHNVQQIAYRFTAAFTGSPVGMALLGRDGRWLRVNPALCRAFGYSEAEMLEMTAVDIIHPDELDVFRRMRREMIEGADQRLEHETRFLHKSGDVHYGIISVTAVRDPDGNATHFTIQLQDTTERHRQEQALRESERRAAEARDEAIHASQLKSRFIANVSHELRTPMNGVIGMLELLDQTAGLTDEQRELVATASSSAELLLAVINDVLDLSKVEAGHLTLQTAPLDLDALLAELRATFAPGCQDRGIAFTAVRDPEVPRIVVGDGLRLRQVLLNLVGNAVKFTEAGAIDVRVSVDDGDWLRIAVRDTGVGVAADELDQLFDAFHQVAEPPARRHAGTGLGLAITRQLVRLMSGEIDVESTVGKGSTFWCTARLPEAAPAPPSEEPPSEESHATLTARPPDHPRTPRGDGRRVLVAEDNAVNQQLAVLRLERHGIAVDVACDGREAVEMSAAEPYDLILMDCYMPVLDGFEATEQIRAREQSDAGHTPIVAMTAGALDSDRERCLAVGMDGFLAKPVRQTDLDAVLVHHLGAAAI